MRHGTDFDQSRAGLVFQSLDHFLGTMPVSANDQMYVVV
jgi:hypothetical protein